jgi:hypothetical protein
MPGPAGFPPPPGPGTADMFRRHRTNLRELNLGGGDVDTGTPMGGMDFTHVPRGSGGGAAQK